MSIDGWRFWWQAERRIKRRSCKRANFKGYLAHRLLRSLGSDFAIPTVDMRGRLTRLGRKIGGSLCFKNHRWIEQTACEFAFLWTPSPFGQFPFLSNYLDIDRNERWEWKMRCLSTFMNGWYANPHHSSPRLCGSNPYNHSVFSTRGSSVACPVDSFDARGEEVQMELSSSARTSRDIHG